MNPIVIICIGGAIGAIMEIGFGIEVLAAWLCDGNGGPHGGRTLTR